MPTILNILACLLLLPSLAQGDSIRLQADAVQVEDGDTLLVKLDGEMQRLQLTGIDAPEDSENPKLKVDLERTQLDRDTLLSLGMMATNHLRDLIAAANRLNLIYLPDDRDRYGRLQGDVRDGLGNNSLARTMVADGFAVVTLDEADSQRSDWLESQKQAYDQKLGLWGLLRKPAVLWAGKYLNP